jgi:transposase-like protein
VEQSVEIIFDNLVKEIKNPADFEKAQNLLLKQGIQSLLKAEMEVHLGYPERSKLIYLALMQIQKKWQKGRFNWATIYNQLLINFDDRVKP